MKMSQLLAIVLMTAFAQSAFATCEIYADLEKPISDKDANRVACLREAKFLLPAGQDAKMDCWGRYTCVVKKMGNRWRIVHEHFSVPVNEEGKAEMNLKPAGYVPPASIHH